MSLTNFSSIDSRITRDLIADQDNHYIENILKNPGKERIQENDFIDVFGEKEIQSDLAMVTRLEDKFASQIEHFTKKEIEKIKAGEKFSEVLEIIIASDGEKYGWLGKNAHLSRASRFDDIVNGVDISLEFSPDREIINADSIDKISLGIDASRNTDNYTLERKIIRNIEKLTGKNNRKLPKIKYFKSAIDENIKEKLDFVIPVVVGLDSNNLNRLMGICSLARTYNNPEKIQELRDMNIDPTRKQKELKERLLKHPVQAVFYRQIVLQLNYYLKVLRNNNDSISEKHKLEINTILNRLKQIKMTKLDISIGSYKEDGVLSTVEEVISEYSKKIS